MDRKIKILYVQHAESIGGSVVSLRELIVDALAAGYECSVVCPNTAIANYYKEIGADAIVEKIAPVDHNTSYSYRLTPMDVLRVCRLLFRVVRSKASLRKIIRDQLPDIIHLNSSTLIPYLQQTNASFPPAVLHIRECMAEGYFGWRKKILRKWAEKASQIIYISEFEQENFRTDPSKNNIIYNYVHESMFVKDTGVAFSARSRYTFITLGGLHKLKGGSTLLTALAYTDAALTVLGSPDPRVNTTALESINGISYRKTIEQLAANNKIAQALAFEGNVSNPAAHIRNADALIFWTDKPHFPRPVFEAWLLGKPVIYYNPGFRNELITAYSVTMVEDESPVSLAKAMKKLQFNPQSDDITAKNIQTARENFTEINFLKVAKVYSGILNLQTSKN